MVTLISNCQTYTPVAPLQEQSDSRKHLYIMEILSEQLVTTPSKHLLVRPYDVIIGQDLSHFSFQSQTGSPILGRLYSLYFDIPGSMAFYTVGDNAIIHDLMNTDQVGEAYIIFNHLQAKIVHAYLDAIEALENIEDADQYSHYQIEKVAGLLFTELLREHEGKVSKSGSNFPDREVKYATRDTQSGVIMKYVREHIHDITLQEAAAHFSYQTNYFSRLCRTLYGTTFNELKTHIKLEIAKEQLTMTTKSLEEISLELGYKALSNFHRNFKAQTGLTPREYRVQKGHSLSFLDEE